MALVDLPRQLLVTVCSLLSCFDVIALRVINKTFLELASDDVVDNSLWTTVLVLLYGRRYEMMSRSQFQDWHVVTWSDRAGEPPRMKRKRRLQDGQVCNWRRATRLILRRHWSSIIKFGKCSDSNSSLNGCSSVPTNEVVVEVTRKLLDKQLERALTLFKAEVHLGPTFLLALTPKEAAVYGLLLMERCAWDRLNAGILFHRARECFQKGQTWWCRFWLAYTASIDVTVQWRLIQKFLPELRVKSKAGEALAQYWYAYVYRFSHPKPSFTLLKTLSVKYKCVQATTCLMNAALADLPSAAGIRISAVYGGGFSTYPPLLSAVKRALHPVYNPVQQLHPTSMAWYQGLLHAFLKGRADGFLGVVDLSFEVDCARVLATEVETEGIQWMVNSLVRAADLGHLTMLRTLLEHHKDLGHPRCRDESQISQWLQLICSRIERDEHDNLWTVHVRREFANDVVDWKCNVCRDFSNAASLARCKLCESPRPNTRTDSKGPVKDGGGGMMM
jgi:hypothetical protein